MGDVCDTDDDNDGIADNLDTETAIPPTIFDFTDGTNFGTITTGNTNLSITDDPANVVNISSTGVATVDVCGISSLSFVAGSSAEISCGSITIEVVSGSVGVTFVGDDGTTVTTTLTMDNKLTFEEDTLILTNNGSTPVELIVNGQTIILDAGASQTIGVILLTTIVIDKLNDIINDNPGTSLADKLEDAVAKLQTALDELNKTSPDNQAATGNIEGAIGDIQAAVDSGDLAAAEGNPLMDQLAGIAEQLASDAIDAAAGGDVVKISDAVQLRDVGDLLRASGDYKDAVNKYKDALSKAEGA